MFTRIVAFALIALLPAGFAAAQNKILAINEVAIETGIQSLSLPVTESGSLLVAPCPGCAAISLQASTATVWIVNGRRVTLAEFKSATGNHGDSSVTVFYPPDATNLLRVVTYLRQAP
ncbi:MAG: hypothetical protein R3E77_13665 [Steroidobacteraceae bacterium]